MLKTVIYKTLLQFKITVFYCLILNVIYSCEDRSHDPSDITLIYWIWCSLLKKHFYLLSILKKVVRF